MDAGVCVHLSWKVNAQNQLRPRNGWQPTGSRGPFASQGQNNHSQINPEALKEPDVHSWLVQQRENCELWNQNIALKECLRNVGQENSALREMCRQKEVNISLLEKKTTDLKAELRFYSEIQQDLKQVSKAFDMKSEKVSYSSIFTKFWWCHENDYGCAMHMELPLESWRNL
ncbi:unnamed protein product [Haemonchus placei]|uniref:SPECC1 n=1 Tax=Haemonchus placei TaxID=6290 RepID=A0A0N4XBU1_HAEPC|nr:unnamed protein product [Haemonchus placei]